MKVIREIVRNDGRVEGPTELNVFSGSPLDTIMGQGSGAIQVEIIYQDGSTTTYRKQATQPELPT